MHSDNACQDFQIYFRCFSSSLARESIIDHLPKYLISPVRFTLKLCAVISWKNEDKVLQLSIIYVIGLLIILLKRCRKII